MEGEVLLDDSNGAGAGTVGAVELSCWDTLSCVSKEMKALADGRSGEGEGELVEGRRGLDSDPEGG